MIIAICCVLLVGGLPLVVWDWVRLLVVGRWWSVVDCWLLVVDGWRMCLTVGCWLFGCVWLVIRGWMRVYGVSCW